MRRRRILVWSLAIFALIALFYALVAGPRNRKRTYGGRSDPNSEQSEKPVTSIRSSSDGNSSIKHVIDALTTPIVFYGKVIDQNGIPVADADITCSVIDKFDANGSKYQRTGEKDGSFTIRGIHGAVLVVGVSKAGYYQIPHKSDGSFAYGIESDSTRRAPPTVDEPAIFVLQKRGQAERLRQVSSRQIDVPQDGRPVIIDLATGRTGMAGQLRLESWVGEPSHRRFDWKYRISVPGGGLTERSGDFDFTAPEEGYSESMEIDMPASSDRWVSRASRQYFVRLPDSRFARFTLELYPGSRTFRNFVVFESYLNPQPGSRNLEFDPAKEIKAR